MSDERAAAIAGLEASRHRFSATLDAVPESLWWTTPPGGGWSVAQTAEHITLAERSVVKLIGRMLFAEPAPPQLLEETRGKDELIRTRFPDRTKKRIAPDFVTPRGTWPTSEAVAAAFQEFRLTNIAAYRGAPADLRSFAAAHPVLGPLDGFQWAFWLTAHLDRHLDQIAEIRERLAHD